MSKIYSVYTGHVLIFEGCSYDISLVLTIVVVENQLIVIIIVSWCLWLQFCTNMCTLLFCTRKNCYTLENKVCLFEMIADWETDSYSAYLLHNRLAEYPAFYSQYLIMNPSVSTELQYYSCRILGLIRLVLNVSASTPAPHQLHRMIWVRC